MKGVRREVSPEEVEKIKKYLEWDVKDSCLRWKIDVSRRVKAGQVAGSRNWDGYLRVGLNKRVFQQHVVVWVLVHGHAPTSEIDHINGIKDDNRPENLRIVSHTENCQNRRLGVANKTGCLGVLTPVGQTTKFQARILNPSSNRRTVIGSFKTFKGAVIARKFMQSEFGYHRFHGDEQIKGLPT